MADPVAEYKSQLADVVGLLRESPDDAGLLSLKADLEELIAITAAAAPAPPATVSVAAAMDAAADRALASALMGEAEELGLGGGGGGSAPKRPLEPAAATAALPDASPAVMAAAPAKAAKKAKLKEFEIPSGLIILDTDTDAEKARKQRAVKSLKNKWREKKREVETEQKQRSWQSFQKKKLGTQERSIFATSEGDAKVGVVSAGGRQLTQGGERKRHKYT